MSEMAVKVLAYQTVTLPCVPGPLRTVHNADPA